jgi:RNA polymerase-binding transcription factor DksA
MKAEILAEIRTKLEQEEIRLSNLLQRTHKHLHRSERLSADFAEQAIETENDEVVEVLDREGHKELRQIKNALNRIFDGTYEQCSECGATIQEARLLAIPETELCVACAGKLENSR